MLNQKQLRDVSLETLSITHSLPTLPDRFVSIQEVLDCPESTLSDLTEIVQTDQATSATLLKVANSSFYNPLGSPVSDLSYAISRLGRQETGSIALSMSLLYGFAIPASIHLIRSFWAHAFAVAQISRFIANKHTRSISLSPDSIFMAALLHDIGRVILGMRVDMSYFEQDFASLNGEGLIDAELEHYGIDHAEVGQVILKQWGIPESTRNIVANHHATKTKSFDTNICIFADLFITQHLATALNIEDVQIQLQEGLFTEAEEAFANSELGEEVCKTY